MVISDSDFLKTLPYREIVCGYGEILKHSLIKDNIFFEYLNLNVSNILSLKSPFIERAIYKSCKIKKSVIEIDEKENKYRKILNFGHTFGHAYEASLGYSKKLNHGEAVILGIVSGLKFSLKKNYIKKKQYENIINHISRTQLPYKLKNYFSLKDLDNILLFMTKDKKNTSSKINLILLKKIGSAIIHNRYSINELKLFMKKELTN